MLMFINYLKYYDKYKYIYIDIKKIKLVIYPKIMEKITNIYIFINNSIYTVRIC